MGREVNMTPRAENLPVPEGGNIRQCTLSPKPSEPSHTWARPEQLH